MDKYFETGQALTFNKTLSNSESKVFHELLIANPLDQELLEDKQRLLILYALNHINASQDLIQHMERANLGPKARSVIETLRKEKTATSSSTDKKGNQFLKGITDKVKTHV